MFAKDELLALPRVSQDGLYDAVLLVPTEKMYEDTEYRIFAVVGMVKGEPVGILCRSDYIDTINGIYVDMGQDGFVRIYTECDKMLQVTGNQICVIRSINI